MGDDRTAVARPGGCRARTAPTQRPLIACLLWLAVLPLAAAAPPERIVSLNLCTDSMLFELLDDARLISVTALARDPDLSFFHERARQLPVNHGEAEEIVALHPDLVVTGANTGALATRLIAQLGVPVLRYEHPNRLADYARDLLHLARTLGVEARARAIVATMEARLARAEVSPQAPRPRAIVYQPNGFTPGRDTLMHDILGHAGLRNVATELGLEFGGYVSLETLLLEQPDVIVFSHRRLPAPSLAEAQLAHPALTHYLTAAPAGRPRQLAVAENLWTCAGLHSVMAVEQLRDRRR